MVFEDVKFDKFNSGDYLSNKDKYFSNTLKLEYHKEQILQFKQDFKNMYFDKSIDYKCRILKSCFFYAVPLVDEYSADNRDLMIEHENFETTDDFIDFVFNNITNLDIIQDINLFVKNNIDKFYGLVKEEILVDFKNSCLAQEDLNTLLEDIIDLIYETILDDGVYYNFYDPIFDVINSSLVYLLSKKPWTSAPYGSDFLEMKSYELFIHLYSIEYLVNLYDIRRIAYNDYEKYERSAYYKEISESFIKAFMDIKKFDYISFDYFDYFLQYYDQAKRLGIPLDYPEFLSLGDKREFKLPELSAFEDIDFLVEGDILNLFEIEKLKLFRKLSVDNTAVLCNEYFDSTSVKDNFSSLEFSKVTAYLCKNVLNNKKFDENERHYLLSKVIDNFSHCLLRALYEVMVDTTNVDFDASVLDNHYAELLNVYNFNQTHDYSNATAMKQARYVKTKFKKLLDFYYNLVDDNLLSDNLFEEGTIENIFRGYELAFEIYKISLEVSSGLSVSSRIDGDSLLEEYNYKKQIILEKNNVSFDLRKILERIDLKISKIWED